MSDESDSDSSIDLMAQPRRGLPPARKKSPPTSDSNTERRSKFARGRAWGPDDDEDSDSEDDLLADLKNYGMKNSKALKSLEEENQRRKNAQKKQRHASPAKATRQKDNKPLPTLRQGLSADPLALDLDSPSQIQQHENQEDPEMAEKRKKLEEMRLKRTNLLERISRDEESPPPNTRYTEKSRNDLARDSPSQSAPIHMHAGLDVDDDGSLAMDADECLVTEDDFIQQSLNISSVSSSAHPPKVISTPASTEPKIMIVIRQKKIEKKYKVSLNAALGKSLDAYCSAMGVIRSLVKFQFDGMELNPSQSPLDLDMEDGDILDAIIQEAVDEKTVPIPEQKKITLIIRQKSEGEKKYKVAINTRLGTALDVYCNAIGAGRETVKFQFDGMDLDPSQSPLDLDMEDGDIVDALLVSKVS